MKLVELLTNYKRMDNKLIIYAQADCELSPDSEVVLCSDGEDGRLPIEVEIDGIKMKYMLEVNIAKEVIEVWSEWRKGRKPTPEEMCEAVIYYAEHDAYLPLSTD